MAKLGHNAPTPEQMQALRDADWDGPLWMINLLKFKEHADYAGAQEPSRTGREAYRRYGELVGPLLQEVGGKPVSMLLPQHVVIGDEGEDWDEVLVVEYPSRDAFLQMVDSPQYQAAAVHRSAALARSALIACKKAL